MPLAVIHCDRVEHLSAIIDKSVRIILNLIKKTGSNTLGKYKKGLVLILSDSI